jgi:hypothetical protein
MVEDFPPPTADVEDPHAGPEIGLPQGVDVERLENSRAIEVEKL